MADEIGQEHEGALEHRYQVHIVRAVAANLRGQFGDPFLDLVFRE